MIYDNQAELKQRIEQTTNRRAHGEVQIFEDTSSYMAIYGGSVLRIDGSDYFIMGDTKEGRFGIEEQPKFWVKYAVHLGSGEAKIIKLVFHEQFSTTVGKIRIQCRRSADKESRFLQQVQGMSHFMQGRSVLDPGGNLVRIIDFIRGPNLWSYVGTLDLPHEQYVHEELPRLMGMLLPAVEALAQMHHAGQHHGDVRNDHLLMRSGTGELVWIDFDFEVNFTDYDIWSMGNVLTYLVGMGLHTFQDVSSTPEAYPQLAAPLDEHDAMVLFRNRVANMSKLFPYIPTELNNILMRFSAGSIDFYEHLDDLVRDLRAIFP